MITEQQVEMLKYFHEEKGDITRWCDWEAMLPTLIDHYPALVAAQRQLVAAEQTMDMIVKQLEPISENESTS